MHPPEVSKILRRQAGVITRQQALAGGLTPRQLDGIVARRAWTPVFVGVYLSSETELSWTAMAHAAVLAGGEGATLVGSPAAALRALTPMVLPITMAIPRCRRSAIDHPKLHLLRLDVPASDRVMVQGLPTTTRLRTAVDIAHMVPLLEAQQLLDRMLVRDHVALGELTDAIAVSRRRGSAQARRLMASANDRAAAESERITRRLLRDAGLTGWQSNYEVTVGNHTLKVDLALVKYRIGIEVKGWMFHSAGDRGASDDRRITDLQLAGWFIIPVGWLALASDPAELIAKVRAAIAMRERQRAA